MAHLLDLLDLVLAGDVDVLGLHSLRNELCGQQLRLSTVRSPVHLDNANQGFEMIQILCVCHLVALVVR